MSRALWHFAVVTPRLADRLRPVCEVDLLERELQESVRSQPAHVAMFSAVLDAWDGVYLPSIVLPEIVPAWARHWERLVVTGMWWPTVEEVNSVRDVTWSLPRRLGREIGAEYANAILRAVQQMTQMQASTGCQALMLFRVIGAVIDDSEFVRAEK